MKKIGKMLFLCSLVLVAAFLATACKPDSGTILGGDGNVLFGGERPDYDGIFDYKSGYVPQEEPFDPDRTLTLTIAEGKGVTFEGGSRSASLKYLDPLPDIVNSNQNLDLVGWYNADKVSAFWNQSSYFLYDWSGSTGSYYGKLMSAFTMPLGNTTIAPFFVEAGRRPLVAASSNLSMYNNATITRTTNRFFQTDLGTQIGEEFTFSGLAGTGAPGSSTKGGFRLQSYCGAADTGSLTSSKYNFLYWFKNTGEEEIKFTAYQVNSGTTLLAGANTGLITLAAGESVRVSINTPSISNTNALTIIDLGKDHANAKFAVVMSLVPIP